MFASTKAAIFSEKEKCKAALAYSVCLNKVVYTQLIYHCANSDRCMSFTKNGPMCRDGAEKIERLAFQPRSAGLSFGRINKIGETGANNRPFGVLGGEVVYNRTRI